MRIPAMWDRVRNSLWFVPAVMTIAAIGLAIGSIMLDRWFIARGRMGEMWFLFGVGADGVRGVLSSIAMSIITVTGVVFSVTVVALQLASTQFTPRVLRGFIEDRANQVVLGVFIATFTFSLVVLRTVHAGDERSAPFVPSVSTSIAMVLVLASIGFLIFFINHVAESIRVASVVERIVRDTCATIRRVYPALDSAEPASRDAARAPTADGSTDGAVCVLAARGGYVQRIDDAPMLRAARHGNATVRLDVRAGDFIIAGQRIATLWTGADANGEAIARAVEEAFQVGPERTLQQDVQRGLIELVDIAVKALSPGINDPNTANLCIDRLGEVLVTFGARATPPVERRSEDGRLRVIYRWRSFDDVMPEAFAAIRHYGASAPIVMMHLLETLAQIAPMLPGGRRDAVRDEALRVQRAAARSIADPDERARVTRVGDRTLAAIASATEQRAAGTSARRE
jgi:uncharacterized membrane protein